MKTYQINLVVNAEDDTQARDLMQKLIGAVTMAGVELEVYALDEVVSGVGVRRISATLRQLKHKPSLAGGT
jgi:hypothetical protein